MANYEKTIVCLANSRKMSGRCIAGKVYEGGKLGEWIRPVSGRPHEEISEEDRRYPDGDRARLLDIVTIPLMNYKPGTYQTENHLIDDNFYWSKEGNADSELLALAVDNNLDTLWRNGDSSYRGVNDRMTLELANREKSSLALIWVDEVDVLSSAEGAAFGNNKRKVRATWEWKKSTYSLVVTDPVIEKLAHSTPDKVCSLGPSFICVSLGEPFNDRVYKLAAAIIPQSRI
jgi:Dual OB-containing domain